jgi:hypothetical protein
MDLAFIMEGATLVPCGQAKPMTSSSKYKFSIEFQQHSPHHLKKKNQKGKKF